MPYFTKRPVIVEARQWDGTLEGASDLVDWILSNDGRASWNGLADPVVVKIDTLEGVMTAQAGDWIIKGVAGEFYPCKPDIFDATYEAVD